MTTRRPARALSRWVVELEAYSAIDACAYDLGTTTRSPLYRTYGKGSQYENAY